jgi:SAM-dependent methyltransferase
MILSQMKNWVQLRVGGCSRKYEAEMAFRRKILEDYEKWYTGEIQELYEVPAPREDQKVKCRSSKHSAILTYLKLVQQPKYLGDLLLDEKAFAGLRLLDIGAGPMPSALVFRDCEVFCLDPLYAEYVELGFPLHYYERTRFICAHSEDIPVEDHFFDAVISVNAIDHVDDFFATVGEIRRVLKPNGKMRMHVHYHKKTATEPLELNDSVMRNAFSWCPEFVKIHESQRKKGGVASPGESFTVWSNFK